MESEHGYFFAWAGFVMIAVVAGDTMICRGVADEVIGDGGLSGMSEKIRGLEEQVRQLRKLVHEKNELSVFSTVDGLPRDCNELYVSGVTTNGVFTISPDGRCPFSVYCDMTRGGWTIIQRRVDGSVNFYRPWNDYVRGFGDVEGEHWLGLDKIHRLTSSGSQVYFQLQNYNGNNDTAHYKSFIVHDVTTAYRMNVDSFGYEGTLNEIFAHHDNIKFSTFDRDNDESDDNCCEKVGGGGWWYKACYKLGNLNGIFEKRDGSGIAIWDSKTISYHRVEISVKSHNAMCT